MAQQMDTRCTLETGGLPSHRGKLEMWVPKCFLEEGNLSVRGRRENQQQGQPSQTHRTFYSLERLALKSEGEGERGDSGGPWGSEAFRDYISGLPRGW